MFNIYISFINIDYRKWHLILNRILLIWHSHRVNPDTLYKFTFKQITFITVYYNIYTKINENSYHMTYPTDVNITCII